MNPDPTRAPEQEVPEAELPLAPPGAEEGHDAAPSEPADSASADAANADTAIADAAGLTDGAPVEPAEAYALAGEELQALTAKAEKAEEYLQLAQRTQADFENYRKRAARDAAIAKERGATKLALDLLPAVDNLERALDHAPAPRTARTARSSRASSTCTPT